MRVPRQIQCRGASNPLLLGRWNSSRSRTELPRRSGLDLDECEGVTVEADDIELPCLGSYVACDDLEALLL